jgi:hypothetical protein
MRAAADPPFTQLLDRMRFGAALCPCDEQLLDQMCNQRAAGLGGAPPMRITCTRAGAAAFAEQARNDELGTVCSGPPRKFMAEDSSISEETKAQQARTAPVPAELTLRVGEPVVCKINTSVPGLYNGSLGVVEEFTPVTLDQLKDAAAKLGVYAWENNLAKAEKVLGESCLLPVVRFKAGRFVMLGAPFALEHLSTMRQLALRVQLPLLSGFSTTVNMAQGRQIDVCFEVDMHDAQDTAHVYSAFGRSTRVRCVDARARAVCRH